MGTAKKNPVLFLRVYHAGVTSGGITEETRELIENELKLM